MKSTPKKNPTDSLLAAFSSEELIEKESLYHIKGGQGTGPTGKERETNDAHTEGDIGNCDNDTRRALDPWQEPELPSH